MLQTVCASQQCVSYLKHNWNITPSVKALGGGAFMRWLVQKGEVLLNGFHALPKETPESFSPLLPHEVSKMSSVSQKGDPTRHHICWHLDSGICQPLKLWEINFCHLQGAFCDSHPNALRRRQRSGRKEPWAAHWLWQFPRLWPYSALSTIWVVNSFSGKGFEHPQCSRNMSFLSFS